MIVRIGYPRKGSKGSAAPGGVYSARKATKADRYKTRAFRLRNWQDLSDD